MLNFIPSMIFPVMILKMSPISSNWHRIQIFFSFENWYSLQHDEYNTWTISVIYSRCMKARTSFFIHPRLFNETSLLPEKDGLVILYYSCKYFKLLILWLSVFKSKFKWIHCSIIFYFKFDNAHNTNFNNF